MWQPSQPLRPIPTVRSRPWCTTAGTSRSGVNICPAKTSGNKPLPDNTPQNSHTKDRTPATRPYKPPGIRHSSSASSSPPPERPPPRAAKSARLFLNASCCFFFFFQRPFSLTAASIPNFTPLMYYRHLASLRTSNQFG